MGPVHVGVRSKAQVRHCGDGPGLLGAAIWAAISEGSQRLTQSPEQGGGCYYLPKSLYRWPTRDHLMPALSSHPPQRSIGIASASLGTPPSTLRCLLRGLLCRRRWGMP